jgi:hypothetical protein
LNCDYRGCLVYCDFFVVHFFPFLLLYLLVSG